MLFGDGNFFVAQDVQKQLSQLILLNGMQTCADIPGCEKLCTTYATASWLSEPMQIFGPVQDLQMPAETLPPQTVFAVKGWNRSVSCLMVLYAAWDSPELLQAWNS